jgi:hypothetical protein
MEDIDTTQQKEEERKKYIDQNTKDSRTKQEMSRRRDQLPNNKRNRRVTSKKSRSNSWKMKASSWWASTSQSLRSSAKRTTVRGLEFKTDSLHKHNVSADIYTCQSIKYIVGT